MAPSTSYLQGQGKRATPQSAPIPHTDQVPNSAGGFAWRIDDWARLSRFLILGSEGGSFYASERRLTTENVGALRRCIAADGVATVDMIVAVSTAGRAPSNTEAIFALALCSASPDVATRTRALNALPEVCRTGTHMFQFLGFVEGERGWGRSLRRGVGAWYAQMPADRLAYQMVKYQEREGWRHRDALRLAHPARVVSSHNPTVDVSDAHAALFDWVKRDDRARIELPETAPEALRAYSAAQNAATPKDTVKLIEQFGGALPREAIKSEHLSTPEVWGALVDAGMPMMALVRNLATLTRVGVLKPLDARVSTVTAQLTDAAALQKARVHPFAVLMALATYRAGQGLRGSTTWQPIDQIIDALDAAFYMAFDNVEATGKRWLLGLDVSSSMGHTIKNSFLSCRDGSAAMAMVTARAESNYHSVAFTSGGWKPTGHRGTHWGGGVEPFSLSPRQRLDDVVRKMGEMHFGGTDCSLPMLYAIQEGLEVDAFVIYTDHETWFGDVHPAQALSAYREKSGIPAKLIVVGMEGSEFSIADPSDAGMLDVVGFDAAAPAVMADFARG